MFEQWYAFIFIKFVHSRSKKPTTGFQEGRRESLNIVMLKVNVSCVKLK